MTCDFGSGTEFLHRPYPYGRDPFLLASGELVGYEGRFFSLPQFALLNDIRLFTDASNHPVASPFKLYINKDAGLAPTLEPRLDASGYELGTPHYVDVITDMRDALDTVFTVHASDSEHDANAFRLNHFKRIRVPYSGTSADDVPLDEFVHPSPAATVPSGNLPPGSSGSIPPPGDGYELGGRQFQDVDMDEIMWQPFVRPKNLRRATTRNIPVEPIFPSVVKTNGTLPSFSTLDDQSYGELGFGASESGGIIITGDRLLAGTSAKLMSNSGASPGTDGAFISNAEWELFPGGTELCQYGANQYDETLVPINASGRKSVYSVPTPPGGEGVYLLAVSESSQTSGLDVQHYPANHLNTTGKKPETLPQVDGTFDGVHITDKLIYNLRDLTPGQPTLGRSPINGKRVFAHFVDDATGPNGQNTASAVYNRGNTIYGYGGIDNPGVNNFRSSTIDFYTTDNLFSPINWSQKNIDSLQPHRGFGPRISTTWDIGDSNFAEGDGTITRLRYAQWGFIDKMICPGADAYGGGQRVDGVITSNTIVYSEGNDPVTGEFMWVQIDEFTSTREVSFFANTYKVNNIFSFFFNRRTNNGLVNVNGDMYVQYSDNAGTRSIPPINKNFTRAVGPRTDIVDPPQAVRDTVVAVGFFPVWALRRFVTTSNQFVIPDTMSISPANASVVSIASGLGVTESDVDVYGPPAWDADAGINYIYFSTTDSASDPAIQSKVFFGKMNTSFEIFEINEVESEDAILFGRSALLSI